MYDAGFMDSLRPLGLYDHRSTVNDPASTFHLPISPASAPSLSPYYFHGRSSLNPAVTMKSPYYTRATDALIQINLLRSSSSSSKPVYNTTYPPYVRMLPTYPFDVPQRHQTPQVPHFTMKNHHPMLIGEQSSPPGYSLEGSTFNTCAALRVSSPTKQDLILGTSPLLREDNLRGSKFRTVAPSHQQHVNYAQSLQQNFEEPDDAIELQPMDPHLPSACCTSFIPGQTQHFISGQTPHFIPGHTPHFIPGQTPHCMPGQTQHFIPGQTPHFIPGQTQHFIPGQTPHFPPHFNRGSVIQLAGGQLKRVEDLQTSDFVQSAAVSENLLIDSSTVLHMRENHEHNTVILGFSVGEKNIQVTVEALLEHPFFVFNQGWASYSPERTLQRYRLLCQPLMVGDQCISITQRNVQQCSALSNASITSSKANSIAITQGNVQCFALSNATTKSSKANSISITQKNVQLGSALSNASITSSKANSISITQNSVQCSTSSNASRISLKSKYQNCVHSPIDDSSRGWRSSNEQLQQILHKESRSSNLDDVAARQINNIGQLNEGRHLKDVSHVNEDKQLNDVTRPNDFRYVHDVTNVRGTTPIDNETNFIRLSGNLQKKFLSPSLADDAKTTDCSKSVTIISPSVIAVAHPSSRISPFSKTQEVLTQGQLTTKVSSNYVYEPHTMPKVVPPLEVHKGFASFPQRSRKRRSSEPSCVIAAFTDNFFEDASEKRLRLGSDVLRQENVDRNVTV